MGGECDCDPRAVPLTAPGRCACESSLVPDTTLTAGVSVSKPAAVSDAGRSTPKGWTLPPKSTARDAAFTAGTRWPYPVDIYLSAGPVEGVPTDAAYRSCEGDNVGSCGIYKVTWDLVTELAGVEVS